ncbi:hypothetical protein LINPERHAP2_LOCUS29214 [Linum perenne]
MTWKSNLNEFCQRKHYQAPRYYSTMSGRAHQPTFFGSVNVNGTYFDSQLHTRSSKEGQEDAARVAMRQLESIKTVVPQLQVEKHELNEAVEYYKNAFAAVETSRTELRRIIYVHLQLASTTIIVSDNSEDSARTVGTRLSLWLESEDVDAIVYKATAAGQPWWQLWQHPLALLLKTLCGVGNRNMFH